MSLLDSDSQRSLIAHFTGQAGAPRGDTATIINENQDLGQLCAEDVACTLELEYLEEGYLSYSQSPFNFATLTFTVELKSIPSLMENDAPLELETLLEYLPAALPSTKRLEYRAQGYRSLIASLQNFQCSCDKLEARRSDLMAIVSGELNQLLLGATNELKNQTSAGTHCDGLRRIKFAPHNSERYISPVVSATIVLVAIIHCMMGVARDHCNLVLKGLKCILRLAAGMQNAQAHIFASNHIDPIPITLPTALQYLGLQDGLDFYVVCPSCDTLYQEDFEKNIADQCTNVNLDGVLCGAGMFVQQHRGNRTWRKPLRRFSHQPLESWLARFLNRPDIEEMLESTCPLNQSPCRDIWGGWFLSNFPGNHQPSFFECPSDELRLAFLVYHDFFNPFSNKTAGKKRSTGLVMMVCLNLPPEVRYDMKNIYVTAMLPGPKEPSLDNINKFLKPIVDNLCEHYDPGVYIAKTHKYPRGRKVRSAVPVSSMDILASRAFSGLGSHSHTCFCSFCTATLAEIDDFNLSHFSTRSLSDYNVCVNRWDAARDSKARATLWQDHGIRRSEWSRFPWWDPFTDTTIAPLHWIKNVLEKQIRENMGCSSSLHHGIPAPPQLSRTITTVEAKWGYLAMQHLSADEFTRTQLPEPLLRYISRERGLFEAGLPARRLAEQLNRWRLNHGFLNTDGSPTRPQPNHAVAIAKTEFYLSRAKQSLSQVESKSTLSSVRGLCNQFFIPWREGDKKGDLMKRLDRYYKKHVTVVSLLEIPREDEVTVLGLEIVDEIKNDMRRTNIPGWLKKPPINFATTDHGKLASEEYKSLALVSLPITLVRLWNNAQVELRERLDHFLHLVAAIRVLSYQSLTEHDILLFESHYQQYLDDLKRLYPYNSITPVQHLGLHIPFFLRKLGPSTRYSENTCEMFIGMLEEISTNSRVGELEQTLHRELIMAANLKATTERWNFSDILEPYAGVIGDFLDNRYAGSSLSSSTSWNVKHKGDPMVLDLDTYNALNAWACANQIRVFTRRLHVCDQLRRGHVVYQPFTESRNNSCILFRPRGTLTAIPGRIDAILQEPDEVVRVLNQARIIVLARSFSELSAEDAAKDVYANHPIVGAARLQIMRLFYDAVNESHVYIIEPDDIVSHVAVCSFADPDRTLSAPCIVVVDLDLKHAFYT